jgi:hypothetical protein
MSHWLLPSFQALFRPEFQAWSGSFLQGMEYEIPETSVFGITALKRLS